MTANHDLSQVERLLRDRERAALDELKRGEESTLPPALDGTIGRLARMDGMQSQQMALHAERRLKLQLDRIRGALSRVKEGTYGSCALCGQEVSRDRLEAVPETPFCTACQARLEREEKA